MTSEKIKANKKTSHIYKKTSRHLLGLAFSQLKEYEKFTKSYSETSEEELSELYEKVRNLRKKMDEVNFRTVLIEAPQTAIDLLAGMKKVDPSEDYRILAEMAVAYHLYRVSASFASQDKTPMSWWFSTFKTILSESISTGRGYQKNHMGNSSYKVCLSAWVKAKESKEFKSMNEYAINEANFPLDEFTSSLTNMLERSYQTAGGSSTPEHYDFTLISRK